MLAAALLIVLWLPWAVQPARSRSWADLAAEALASGEIGVAARIYERAGALEKGGAARRLAWLGTAALQYYRAREFQHADRLFGEVAAEAAEVGLPGIAGKALVSQAAVARAFNDPARAWDLLELAEPHLPHADVSTRVSAYSQRAVLLQLVASGESAPFGAAGEEASLDKAWNWLERAKEEARRAGELALVDRCEVFEVIWFASSGRPEQAVALADRLRQRARERGDVETLSRVEQVRQYALYRAGKKNAVARESLPLADRFAQMDRPRAALEVLRFRALFGWPDREWDVLAECLSRAEELVDRVTPGEMEPSLAVETLAQPFLGPWPRLAQDLASYEAQRRREDPDREAARGLLAAVLWKRRGQAGRWGRRAGRREGEELADVVAFLRDRMVADDELYLDLSEGMDGLYVCALSKEAIVRRYVPERADVARDAALFAQAVREGTLRSSAPARAAGARLSARLLAPAFELIGRPPRRLLVSPCSDVEGLPFAALPRPGSEDEREDGFLCEVTAVAQVASLVREPDSRRGWKVPRSIMVVGDPETDPSLGLPRLPGARREALDVATLYLTDDGFPEAAPSVDVLLGRRATRRRVLQGLSGSGVDVAHLACHGRADPADDRATCLYLAPDGLETDRITVRDVLGLERPPPLVVLSVCQSGRGRVLGPAGVRSLASSFLYSGSRAAVATLWVVRDDASTALMRAFHGALRRSDGDPVEALRQAQVRALRGELAWRIGAAGRGKGRKSPRAAGSALPIDTWAAFSVFVRS